MGERGHWELSRSDAAAEYVWKEDTRVPGTQFEFGSRPFQTQLQSRVATILGTRCCWRPPGDPRGHTNTSLLNSPKNPRRLFCTTCDGANLSCLHRANWNREVAKSLDGRRYGQLS